MARASLRPRRRRDWGRVLARFLCLVFALIGAIPMALGAVVRTAPIRDWAARETSAILRRELGLAARFRVHVEAWPLAVGLDDLVVDATDGPDPALVVARVRVRPRFF